MAFPYTFLSCAYDESIIREKIINAINSTLFNVSVEYRIYEADSIQNFFRSEVKFDIAFLDIEIGSQNGIELAKFLYKTNPNCVVVFITSFEHYMKESFGLNVFAYIMKDEMNERISYVMMDLLNALLSTAIFNLKCEDGITTYNSKDIYYFCIENRKIYVQTNETTQIYYTSLKKLMLDLNENFTFVGSKYIVNFENVKKIYNGNIELTNDQCISIPKGKVKEISAKYRNHLMRKVR